MLVSKNEHGLTLLEILFCYTLSALITLALLNFQALTLKTVGAQKGIEKMSQQLLQKSDRCYRTASNTQYLVQECISENDRSESLHHFQIVYNQ